MQNTKNRTVTVVCANCGNEYEIEKREYERKTKNGSNFFCSRSCAATYNNKVYKKRQKTAKVIEAETCPICGGKKWVGTELCRECENNRRRQKKREKTLGDYVSGDDKYLTHKCQTIRKDARIFMEKESKQEKVCAYCHNHEFDDILEVHHIKGILTFDMSTKLKDINCDENLVWLCPNHHAMLERGLIELNGAMG